MTKRERCEAGLAKIRDILVDINNQILEIDLENRDADTESSKHLFLRAARERTLNDYHKLKEYMQGLAADA